VVTLDRRGQPVVDLNQDDFQVFDSGRRQRIVFFRPPESMKPKLPLADPPEFGNRRDWKFVGSSNFSIGSGWIRSGQQSLA